MRKIEINIKISPIYTPVCKEYINHHQDFENELKLSPIKYNRIVAIQT